MEGADELEHYLRNARILDASTFTQHGAHTSYRLILEGGVGALAKPADQAPADGAAVVRNEVAAWVIARELQWSDLVSTTVLREVPSWITSDASTEASVQVLWPSFDPGVAADEFPDDDQWRAAIFDTLVVNGDRHPANWGAVPGSGQRRLKLVDHGYAFSYGQSPPNSPFFQGKRHQELPAELLEDVGTFLASTASGELADLLGDNALEQLLERCRHVAENGTLDVPS